MIYEVQCQFIPGNSQIWVARLNSEDPIYKYDNVEEAQAKANELQAADETGRQYRVTGLETAAPTEEIPTQETSIEETLTEETPIEEVPVETSIEEIPTEETLTEETPIEENPT